jgi:hypothetical protein
MVDGLDSQTLESFDAANDIEYRVHRPNLVEVDFFGRDAVDSALCLTDQLKGAHRASFDPIGNRCALDQLYQLANVPTMWLLRDRELDLLAGNPRASHVSNRNAHIPYPEPAR